MRLIDRLKTDLRISGHAAKKLLDRRLVFVNDRRVWIASYEVSAMDRVTSSTPSPPRRPQSGSFTPVILWQDKDILALDKPAGICSTGPQSVESLLRKKHPGLHAVHRLDKETSGILLFGLSPAGTDGLLRLFKDREIDKRYFALVAGRFPAEIKRIDEALEGEPSLTEFRILDSTSEASLLEVRIRTGRTHQIRRHLELKGFHLLGEKEYAKGPERKEIFRKITRPMLHAGRINFLHPVSKEKVFLISPAPHDFIQICSALGIKNLRADSPQKKNP